VRALGDQRLELADQLNVMPKREVRVDAFLDNRDPQILEAADLGLREGLESNSASAGPRQSSSACRSKTDARSAPPSPSAVRPSANSRSKRCRSSASGSISSR